jgi:hypothetical protein
MLQFVFDAVFHFFTFSSSFQLPTSCTYVDDDKKMIKKRKEERQVPEGEKLYGQK